MSTQYDKTIKTPFFSDAAFNAIDGLMGQLSDGMWENSRAMEKYWQNMQVHRRPDGQVVMAFNTSSWYSPFERMSDDGIKAWVASHIKQVVRCEAKDNGWEKGYWNSGSALVSGYLHDVTVGDAYVVCKYLEGKWDDMTAGVFGSPRDAETTKKVEDAQARLEEIYAIQRSKYADEDKVYAAEKKAAEEAHWERRRKIGDEYREEIDALRKVIG